MARLEVPGSAAEWPWSSARAHLSGGDDGLVKVAPMLAMVKDSRALLDSAMPEEELKQLRDHGRTGHPLGNAAFVAGLEETVGRILRPRKPGRKRKLSRLPN